MVVQNKAKHTVCAKAQGVLVLFRPPYSPKIEKNKTPQFMNRISQRKAANAHICGAETERICGIARACDDQTVGGFFRRVLFARLITSVPPATD